MSLLVLQSKAIWKKRCWEEGAECRRRVALLATASAEAQAVRHRRPRCVKKRVGDTGLFVITRNINFTTCAYMGCRFLYFCKRKRPMQRRSFNREQVADKAEEAWLRACGTEVVYSRGLQPRHSARLLPEINYRGWKKRARDFTFTPLHPCRNLWYAVKKGRLGAEVWLNLKALGLGSIAGQPQQEILDTKFAKNDPRTKLTTEKSGLRNHLKRALCGCADKPLPISLYGHRRSSRFMGQTI